MKNEMHPVLRVRLFAGDEKCFGPGIAELLQRVAQEGSLRRAALAMHMAYSKAWGVIRDCEHALGYPLLHYSTGGRHGGGAVLTPEGRRLLDAYCAYNRELQAFAQTCFCTHFPPSGES